MTCKDCIYFKRCVVLGVELDIKRNKEADKNCRHFKNKADFVEVVECSNCKYAHFNKDACAYSCKRRDYYSEFVKPTDYCSYGERKND